MLFIRGIARDGSAPSHSSEGRGMLRSAFGRRNEFTCCFCCHVRMGTVFLGVFSLIKDLLAVTIITALTLHPELIQRQSSVISSYLGLDDNANSTINDNSTFWVADSAWDCDDKLLGLLLTIGSSLLTISLLYGVITARPRYILPYFWLQMFDFCVTSLTVIGYFSYGPDIKRWIAAQKSFPLREELLSLGGEWLLMMAALMAITILWVKAYCISIVWSCYKYLISRLTSPVSAIATVGGGACDEDEARLTHEAQMALPPKYEDIVPVMILNSAGGGNHAAACAELMNPPTPPPPYCEVDLIHAEEASESEPSTPEHQRQPPSTTETSVRID